MVFLDLPFLARFVQDVNELTPWLTSKSKEKTVIQVDATVLRLVPLNPIRDKGFLNTRLNFTTSVTSSDTAFDETAASS